MKKYSFHVQQSNVVTYCVHLLLVSTIVTKSINCFVLENTEWSTMIADTNRHESSDNVTTATIDDSTGQKISTEFLPKITGDDDDGDDGNDRNNNNADDEYSALAKANDVTSMNDIETGKY